MGGNCLVENCQGASCARGKSSVESGGGGIVVRSLYPI